MDNGETLISDRTCTAYLLKSRQQGIYCSAACHMSCKVPSSIICSDNELVQFSLVKVKFPLVVICTPSKYVPCLRAPRFSKESCTCQNSSIHHRLQCTDFNPFVAVIGAEA